MFARTSKQGRYLNVERAEVEAKIAFHSSRFIAKFAQHFRQQNQLIMIGSKKIPSTHRAIPILKIL